MKGVKAASFWVTSRAGAFLSCASIEVISADESTVRTTASLAKCIKIRRRLEVKFILNLQNFGLAQIK
jgi:hypothetical protein